MKEIFLKVGVYREVDSSTPVGPIALEDIDKVAPGLLEALGAVEFSVFDADIQEVDG